MLPRRLRSSTRCYLDTSRHGWNVHTLSTSLVRMCSVWLPPPLPIWPCGRRWTCRVKAYGRYCGLASTFPGALANRVATNLVAPISSRQGGGGGVGEGVSKKT